MRKSTGTARKSNPGLLATLGNVAMGTAVAVGKKALDVSMDAVDSLARLGAGKPKPVKRAARSARSPRGKAGTAKKSGSARTRRAS